MVTFGSLMAERSKRERRSHHPGFESWLCLLDGVKPGGQKDYLWCFSYLWGHLWESFPCSLLFINGNVLQPQPKKRTRSKTWVRKTYQIFWDQKRALRFPLNSAAVAGNEWMNWLVQCRADKAGFDIKSHPRQLNIQGRVWNQGNLTWIMMASPSCHDWLFSLSGFLLLGLFCEL